MYDRSIAQNIGFWSRTGTRRSRLDAMAVGQQPFNNFARSWTYGSHVPICQFEFRTGSKFYIITSFYVVLRFCDSFRRREPTAQMSDEIAENLISV